MKMDTSWPEKLTNNREKLIEQLVQGQGFATQLQLLLREVGNNINNGESHGSGTTLSPGSFGDLVGKVLRSFTETLTVINSPDFNLFSGDDTAGRNLAVSSSQVGVDSVSSDDIKSELNSGKTMKRPVTYNKRGCYKRKKIAESQIRISRTIEDGQAWRKYGQKEILNSKFPRNYYRCTHKYDQGCKATKQVQKMEDNPEMYHITYIDRHTCASHIVKAPKHVITTQDSSTSSSCFAARGAHASGSNSKVDYKAEDCLSFGSFSGEIKQEFYDKEPQETPEVIASSYFEDNEGIWKEVLGSFDDHHPLETHCGELVSSLYSASENSGMNVDFSCDFDFDHETDQFF